jgi:CRISPR-associated DxTHG motif protein
MSGKNGKTIPFMLESCIRQCHISSRTFVSGEGYNGGAMRRIVTFLGLGNKEESPHYAPAIYDFEGRRTAPTPLHDVATVLGEPCSLVVLGTERVRDRWFSQDLIYERLLEEGLRGSAPGAPLPTVGFVELPNGEEEGERWEIFRRVVATLSPSPLELEHPSRPVVREPEAPSQVILDITHGFRSQPFFAAAAVAFVRSEERRRREPGPEIRILYAAFDRDREVAPVWELTQLLEVLDWDAAIDSLMQHGRADDLKRLGRETQRRANRKAQEDRLPFPRIKTFAEACASFADGLATARTGELLTLLGPRLAREVDAARGDLERLVPPAAHQLDTLKAWAGRIAADSVISEEGLWASLALTQLYLELERFAEAAGVLREALVSAYGLKARSGERILQPKHGCTGWRRADHEGFDDQRHGYDQELGKAAREGVDDPIVKLYRELGHLRNDVEHAGMNSDARSASAIREQLERALGKARALLAPGADGDAPGQRREGGASTFVNLSNHGIATWSTQQLEAARALRCGEPTDLAGGLSEVEPDATTDEVVALARTLADRALGQGAVGAFVAGEHVLTVALVTELQRRGIRCFCTTTQRRVQERALDGGGRELVRTFYFLGWREYPRIA